VSPRSVVESVSAGLARGFKGEPLFLALVLLNGAFLAAIYASLRSERSERHLEMKIMLERCLPEHRDAN
jgi:hypothetical protein